MRPDTREKSCWSAARTLRARVSFIICISAPSSTPCGWGLISIASRGISFATRS
jgi:hypothetical protein